MSTDKIKSRYIQYGYCKRCGACCLVEDPPCPHLGWAGNIAICLIFDSPDRPLRCRLYPEVPPLNFDTCGYYFKDTWNKNKIVTDVV
jgi:hypothetical protein